MQIVTKELWQKRKHTTLFSEQFNIFGKAHFKPVNKKSFDTISQAVFMTLENVFE